MEGHSYSGIDDHSKARYLINGIKNDKLEVVKTHVISSPALRQYFTRVFSLFSDYIKQCEGMNHPVRNISEVSAESGRRDRGGRGRGHGGRVGQGVRGGYKGPPTIANEITTCTHMSDQYFSDNNYKYLSPADKARLWQIRKKRSGNESNTIPPPSMINQV